MAEKYTGQAMDRRYKGENADIKYSLKRCIHAEQCVHQLGQVFNKDARPWINAQNASADEITRVVMLCPSGALHVERHDDAVGEAIPTQNSLTLWHNGPLQFSGDLTIEGTAVALEHETRATLCRCGASERKPFCDNSHLSIQFEAADPTGVEITPLAETGGTLKITVHPNSPFQVEGNFEIRNAAGEVIFAGQEAWLCRCGGSQNKPFCDSTHRKNGFQAE